MTVPLLSFERMEKLRVQPFTYDKVGASAATPLPDGYRHVERSHVLNHQDFEAAVNGLMTWHVHRKSGLSVKASSATVGEGVVVMMRLGIASVGLRAPCRVVYVIDEPDAQGFAYGTLPGHPESGEERFVLTRHADGTIAFTISGFSRPQTWAARIVGPVGRWGQGVVTDRYLAALDH